MNAPLSAPSPAPLSTLLPVSSCRTVVCSIVTPSVEPFPCTVPYDVRKWGRRREIAVAGVRAGGRAPGGGLFCGRPVEEGRACGARGAGGAAGGVAGGVAGRVAGGVAERVADGGGPAGPG
ncbi:hypothetical protein GCM10014719_01240 [Planomonospora parontospora subsp. antibiotica]|nr:hypothetical protein GCM10014719_01240 [Planomonospora parontospora subsp. antibiotica]GII13284.1 hypothetical protein Ppa05_00100 [Planomonospora parontospora subsp. antibiotica]